MIRKITICFALWLLKRCGYSLDVDERYVSEAAKVCATLQSWDAGGIAKHHRAFKELLKKFPDATHRDLSLAIEYGLRRLDAR